MLFNFQVRKDYYLFIYLFIQKEEEEEEEAAAERERDRETDKQHLAFTAIFIGRPSTFHSYGMVSTVKKF